MSRYELFDRSQVELWDLVRRGHDLLAEDCLPPVPPEKPYAHADLGHLVRGSSPPGTPSDRSS